MAKKKLSKQEFDKLFRQPTQNSMLCVDRVTFMLDNYRYYSRCSLLFNVPVVNTSVKLYYN